MSWITTKLAAANNAAKVDVTHVVWSEDGATVSTKVVPTAVTLKSATDANPSVVATDGPIETAEASDGCTITHFAFANIAGEVTTLQTTWIALAVPAVLVAGVKITVVDGGLTQNLHQTDSAPS